MFEEVDKMKPIYKKNSEKYRKEIIRLGTNELSLENFYKNFLITSYNDWKKDYNLESNLKKHLGFMFLNELKVKKNNVDTKSLILKVHIKRELRGINSEYVFIRGRRLKNKFLDFLKVSTQGKNRIKMLGKPATIKHGRSRNFFNYRKQLKRLRKWKKKLSGHRYIKKLMRFLKKKKRHSYNFKLFRLGLKKKKRYANINYNNYRSLWFDSKNKHVIIPLDTYQLFRLGLFLGHSEKFSIFLGTWCVQGWRRFQLKGNFNKYSAFFQKYAIMDLMPSILNIRLCLEVLTTITRYKRTVWFICHHKFFGPYIARYAILCGEVYSVFSWVSGSLTNFSYVYLYYHSCLHFWSKGYELQHRQRKRLMTLAGLNFSRTIIPGFVFLPRVLESITAMSESANLTIPTFSLVDSNVNSTEMSFPIPGNDDSMICINFFCYLVTKKILYAKLRNLLFWKYKLRKQNRRHSILVLAYICFFFDSYIGYKDLEYLPFFSWALYKGNIVKDHNYDEYNKTVSLKNVRGNFTIFDKNWFNLKGFNLTFKKNLKVNRKEYLNFN
jgi:ribosomal protein S2